MISTSVARLIFVRLALGAIAASLLTGCQSTEARKQQLAQICADPLNRQVGTFYFDECESLYPLTNAQKAKLIQTYGPSGPPAAL